MYPSICQKYIRQVFFDDSTLGTCIILMALYNHLTKDIMICHNDEKITLYEFIVKNKKVIWKKNGFKIMLTNFI